MTIPGFPLWIHASGSAAAVLGTWLLFGRQTAAKLLKIGVGVVLLYGGVLLLVFAAAGR